MTNTKRTTPLISIGRDFIIGDISGPVAIGENITQYIDCIFVRPDGSRIHGKSWRYIQGIRPNTDPKEIFGRLEELEKIDELFKNNSVLALTGFRGVGKSTLASMYVDMLEERGNWQEFIGVKWMR